MLHYCLFVLYIGLSFPLLATIESTSGSILELSSKATPIPDNPSAVEVLDEVGISIITLPNGLKVYLKPTEGEKEVYFNLSADGGWTAFPPGQATAAKYCGTIALDSGFSHLSTSELDKLLFRYSLEVSARTRPFHRNIESTCPPEHLNYLLAILHHYFIDINISLNGMERVIERTADAIAHRLSDCETLYEDLYLSANSGGHPFLYPTSPAQIRSVRLSDVEKTFNASFSRLADFSATIVGPFTVEAITPLLLRYLGTIPEQASSATWPGPSAQLNFPSGIFHQEIYCGTDPESLTRLTFPLAIPLNQNIITEFEIATQVLEERLRTTFTERFNSTQAVDVQYHLPLYPRISPVWLTIQYRCDQSLIQEITDACLKELALLKEKGPTDKELLSTKILLQRINTFWIQQDSFWLATLFNHIQWGWDISCINGECDLVQLITQERIHQIINDSYSLENYTLLSLHPGKKK